MRTFAALVATVFTSPAWAHGGIPALAELSGPGACVRVDQSVALRWTEPTIPSIFGPSMVQLFHTQTSTRPLYPRELPLTAWNKIHEVLDSDPTNAFVWRTATVAAGHYFLWSHMVEPPMENADFAAFAAPFVVTVERPGAWQGPTVRVTRPASVATSFGRYLIHYAACDPSGTGRVRLEAASESRPDEYYVIADDLPAVESGTVAWDTTALARTRWIVRGRIYDQCGHVFESHARAFVQVSEPVDPVDAGPPDVLAAGPIDARTGGGAACQRQPPDAGPATADAGITDRGSADGAVAPCDPDDAACDASPGCGCAAGAGRGAGASGGVSALLALAVMQVMRARRRRRG